jgi:hypothetical protein
MMNPMSLLLINSLYSETGQRFMLLTSFHRKHKNEKRVIQGELDEVSVAWATFLTVLSKLMILKI